MRLESNLGLKSYEEYVEYCESQNAKTLNEIRRQGRLVAIEYTRKPGRTYRSDRFMSKETTTRGEPTGVLVAYELSNGGLVFGWSSRHPTKERRPFRKSVAVHKALLRAKASETSVTSMQEVPMNIWDSFNEFVNTVSTQLDDLKRKRNAALIASE